MIERAEFGRTGHVSTRVIFGGAALFEGSPDKADRCLDLLLQYGINHIDTAADYGESEKWIGRWMGAHRERFFLATKTSARDGEGASLSLKRSLDRLRVEQVDLVQLHCLIDPDEWETAFGPRGALEALVGARDQGLARFIGVTAHDVVAPNMLLKSLENFAFDSVLAPYNYPMMQLLDYASSLEKLLQICAQRGVAVQTIKSIARRPKCKESGHTTWYEPLSASEDIDQAVHWVLGREGIFLNSVADVELLPRVLDSASRHRTSKRPTDSEMESLTARQGMRRIFPIEDETSEE
jgi:aryl-alcohol dehydrogenase-like predicted oxidoreductase